MKHYCLKPEAKAQLIEVTSVITASILFLLFLAGIVGLPLSLVVTPQHMHEIIVSYIGILSWTAVFSFIAIGTKRWLQSNIVEC